MSDAIEAEAPWKAKKNTRRWCKGKHGVEHTWQNGPLPNWSFGTVPKVDICQRCGKRNWATWKWLHE